MLHPAIRHMWNAGCIGGIRAQGGMYRVFSISIMHYVFIIFILVSPTQHQHRWEAVRSACRAASHRAPNACTVTMVHGMVLSDMLDRAAQADPRAHTHALCRPANLVPNASPHTA
jgi:hypothetical protein